MKTEIFNKDFGAAVALLAFVCYASFWFGLGATRLWDRDEPRNARCAVEMLERHDWVVPYFNDQLRTHKPILLYWMEMSAYQVFGENAFAARMPSALMGTLSILAIAILAGNFLGRMAGIWSACALATSAMMVVAARAATPDASLICTSCWGVVGLVMHWRTQSTRLTVWWFIGFSALGLAILAKGPVGIVLPSIVVGLWCVIQELERSWQAESQLDSKPVLIWPRLYRYWLYRYILQFLRAIGLTLTRLRVAPGLLLAISIAAPWYIWVGFRTDGEWLRGFFWEHNFSRAVSAMEGHRGGLWYYPAAALVGLFPWSLMLIPIGMWTWKGLFSLAEGRNGQVDRPLRQMTLLGVVWIGVYMACFSIARTKLPSYITPCYPGASLLIGGFLSQWSQGLKVLSRGMMWSGAAVHAIVGVVMSVGLVLLGQQVAMDGLGLAAMWPLLLAGVAVLMVFLADSHRQRGMPWAMVGASAMLLASVFGIIAPKVDANRSDLNAMASKSGDVKWFSVGTIEPSWVFYMRRPIEELALDESGKLSGSERIVEHLKSRDVRLLVREDQWDSLQTNLKQDYALEAVTVSDFSVFLKNRRLLVIQPRLMADSNLSQHNSSNVR